MKKGLKCPFFWRFMETNLRKFYAFVCKEKGKEQACISLVYDTYTPLVQEAMDALAFDGAWIKEGRQVSADGRVEISDSLTYWMDDTSISLEQFAQMEFHHGANAKIEKA